MRKISIVFLVLLFSVTPCFALSASTYADLAQNSSQVTNLVSQASSQSGFFDCDYVVFRSGNQAYYIYWSDSLVFNNNRFTSGSGQYISYTYSGNTWSYSGIVSDPGLSLSASYVVTTSLSGYSKGQRSSLYDQYYFYHYGLYFFIFFLGLLFALVLKRR